MEKPIPGYENYLITTSGQVTSLSYGATKKPRSLKTQKSKHGYNYVVLTKDRLHKVFTIHRLVATTFIPNPLNLPQVNHRNGIKHDNRIENLEWVSCSQNHRHAYDSGLRAVGNLHKEKCAALGRSKRKLTTEQVEEIKKSRTGKRGEVMALARKYNINHKSIGLILKGQLYGN